MSDRRDKITPSWAVVITYTVAAVGAMVLAMAVLWTGPEDPTFSSITGYLGVVYVSGHLFALAEEASARRARAVMQYVDEELADDQQRRDRWAGEEDVPDPDQVKAWPRPLDGEVWPDETGTENLTEKARQLGRMSPAQRDLHAQHGWPLHKPGPY